VENMSKKFTLEYVQEYYASKNCILISDHYENNRTKLKFQCSCGNFHESTFDTFKQHPRCPACGNNNKKHPKTFSYEYVQSFFKENNCVLISDNYKGYNQKLEYICECGRKSTTKFYSFKNGSRCFDCGLAKIGSQSRHSLEYVKTIFADGGCEVISEEYKNASTLLDFICSCGNIGEIRLFDFINGCRCKLCSNERKSKAMIGRKRPDITGSNHPQWDENKSTEERERGRFFTEYKQWRTQVYLRDKFTCQCCGDSKGGNLNAHHLDSWDWCKDLRFEISNGMTLCDLCHDDFHGIYGFGNNTKEQWIEYMDNILEEYPIFNLI
jgi:hypothetical protein